MNEPTIPYYFEAKDAYPKVTSAFFGGGTQADSHNTLEGEMQQFLDGIHYIVRQTWGDNAVGLDGALAQQCSLAYTLAQLQATATFYPRFYRDVIPEGQTADAILAKYQDAAKKLFAAYGVS